MSPLKEMPAKEGDVLTSTPQKQSKQVPPLTGGETSPSGTTVTPPSTPTKTPLHRRLSRHSSYGYRQACDFQRINRVGVVVILLGIFSRNKTLEQL